MPIRGRDCSLWRPWDVPRPRYAVLDGVSPAYPPATGRLHTCYSPVRRSPATAGKPAAPLPLDLHVLSLSLAFILSQDQTLRCLSCLLSLFRLFRQDNCLLFCSVCRTTFRETPWRMTDCIVLGRNLTETHILGGVAASYPCLILYYFVSLLKSLNVLFFPLSEAFCSAKLLTPDLPAKFCSQV